jgi:hypothetical protein
MVEHGTDLGFFGAFFGKGLDLVVGELGHGGQR